MSLALVVKKCCPCDDDEMDDSCRCLCHVTSPQIIMTLADYLADESLQVWHNETWHLYRQPDASYPDQAPPNHNAFFLLHVPSHEGQLDYAPPDFLVALIGADTQGIGHAFENCKDCVSPYLDDHPTLAKWYQELRDSEVRRKR